MNPLRIIVLLSTLTIAQHAVAKLAVFACEPEWGALATEIGGDAVSVFVATTALQDPHQIQARPSLIAKTRNADLLVCSGAELEIGWLPMLLRQAGNAGIQVGKPGYFLAADHVRMLEVPTRLDRSEGDVHPSGNPHIQTDPRNIGLVAKALAERMGQLDPQSAAAYQARLQDFSARWDSAVARWTAKAAPLRAVRMVVHHKAWPYLEAWLGLEEAAALEPKPGLPPSSAHLAEILALLQAQPAAMVIRAAYQDQRPAEWLADRAHLAVVVLPFTVGGSDRATDLFSLYDDTVDRLLAALQ